MIKSKPSLKSRKIVGSPEKGDAVVITNSLIYIEEGDHKSASSKPSENPRKPLSENARKPSSENVQKPKKSKNSEKNIRENENDPKTDKMMRSKKKILKKVEEYEDQKLKLFSSKSVCAVHNGARDNYMSVYGGTGYGSNGFGSGTPGYGYGSNTAGYGAGYGPSPAGYGLVKAGFQRLYSQNSWGKARQSRHNQGESGWRSYNPPFRSLQSTPQVWNPGVTIQKEDGQDENREGDENKGDETEDGGGEDGSEADEEEDSEHDDQLSGGEHHSMQSIDVETSGGYINNLRASLDADHQEGVEGPGVEQDVHRKLGRSLAYAPRKVHFRDDMSVTSGTSLDSYAQGVGHSVDSDWTEVNSDTDSLVNNNNQTRHNHSNHARSISHRINETRNLRNLRENARNLRENARNQRGIVRKTRSYGAIEPGSPPNYSYAYSEMVSPAEVILGALPPAPQPENIYEEIRTPPRSPTVKTGKVKKSTKRRGGRTGLTATRSADPRIGGHRRLAGWRAGGESSEDGGGGSEAELTDSLSRLALFRSLSKGRRKYLETYSRTGWDLDTASNKEPSNQRHEQATNQDGRLPATSGHGESRPAPNDIMETEPERTAPREPTNPERTAPREPTNQERTAPREPTNQDPEPSNANHHRRRRRKLKASKSLPTLQDGWDENENFRRMKVKPFSSEPPAPPSTAARVPAEQHLPPPPPPHPANRTPITPPTTKLKTPVNLGPAKSAANLTRPEGGKVQFPSVASIKKRFTSLFISSARLRMKI